jgi:hypothetical protein
MATAKEDSQREDHQKFLRKLKASRCEPDIVRRQAPSWERRQFRTCTDTLRTGQMQQRDDALRID